MLHQLSQAAQAQVPASAGFPQEYPVVQSIVDGTKTYLRPLREPLYDTELILTPTVVQQVTFFQRALSNTTAAGALVKTLSETNLRNQGLLPTPNHFQIFGFLFETSPDISIANFNNLYATANFRFSFGGSNFYLTIPLQKIPTGIGPSGFASTTVAATSLGSVTNGLGSVQNVYTFTIGKKALQIRPNEAFNAEVNWPTAAPVLAAFDFAGGGVANIRLRTYIMGLFYKQL